VALVAGKDVTAATAAITAARAAIESARTAVVAQAAKTYVLDASAVTTTPAADTSTGQSELMKKLKISFQSLHKALFKDLFALRDGPMKDERQAVQNALQTIRQVPGVDEKEVSPTAAEVSQ
jgi:hypothetical protein